VLAQFWSVRLTSSKDKLNKVAKGKQPLPPPTGQTPILFGLAFSPDGRLLASGNGQESIKLWDVAGRRQAGRTLTKIGSTNITSLSFSPDGQSMAVLYDLTEACLWDVSPGALIGSLRLT
jgi:WD40 repeat protein